MVRLIKFIFCVEDNKENETVNELFEIFKNFERWSENEYASAETLKEIKK